MSMPPVPFLSQADTLCSDSAAMALHMHQCAQARGRWFGFKSGLQHLSSATAGRLVTASCIGVLLTGVLVAFT